MRMRIDEAGHHDTALGIELDRIRRSLEVVPRISATRGDDHPIARREPTALDRTNIACCRADAGPLILQRRQREKASASYDEIRFHRSLEGRGGCRERAPRPRYHG